MKKQPVKITDLAAQAAEFVKLEAELASAHAALKESQAKLLEAHNAIWGAAQDRRNDLLKALEKFVSRNRETLLGTEKHVDLGAVRVGFRLDPWSVQKLDDSDTWDEIAQDVSDIPALEKYVEKEVSLRRAVIIADRENIDQGTLTSMGVYLAQPESFYVQSL